MRKQDDKQESDIISNRERAKMTHKHTLTEIISNPYIEDLQRHQQLEKEQQIIGKVNQIFKEIT